jgi:predicted ATPase
MKNFPFKVVLTGGPCCGKTTLINELRKRGHFTTGEVAREVLDEWGTGKNNYEKLQEEIAKRQYLLESEVDDILEWKVNKLMFLDRGVIDGVAYSKLFLNKVPKCFGSDSRLKGRYDAVLLLDRLPFIADGTRVENGDEEAEKIHNEIRNSYIQLGYFPISVPVIGTPNQRADYVTKLVERLK